MSSILTNTMCISLWQCISHCPVITDVLDSLWVPFTGAVTLTSFFPMSQTISTWVVSSFHTTGSKSHSSLIGTYAQILSSQTTTGLKSSGKLRKKSKQNLKAICYQAETGRKKGYLLLSLLSNRCCK